MTVAQREFRREIQETLGGIDPKILSHNEEEFWMIQQPYEYIEFIAYEKGLRNTAIALPLVVGLHDGSHRKSPLIRDGVTYKVPYVIHCLMVCRILMDLNIPFSREDEDILYASALCHDAVEDVPFEKKGRELYEDFSLDKRVYDIVRRVSKRRDFTPDEEIAFFHGIEENRFSLLVKLSDRSNNVEDLYNMPVWKIHEYIGETNRYFLPMGSYGLEHYTDIASSIDILVDKILQLTRVAEVLVDRHEEQMTELAQKLLAVRDENMRLRKEWKDLWEEDAE